MAIDGVSGVSAYASAYTSPYANPRRESAGASDGTNANGLTPEQQQQVQRLKQIDQKVRAHEQAHLSAAAGLAISGANFQTVRGPDGKQYAVAGEVTIDVSPAQTPEQTIEKARRIQAAALAPADPSSQDRAVAAAAAQMQLQAQVELNKQRQEEQQTRNGDNGAQAPTTDRNNPLAAYAALEPAPESLFSVFA